MIERNIKIDLSVQGPFSGKFTAGWNEAMADIKANEIEINSIEQNTNLTIREMINVNSFRLKLVEKHDINQKVLDNEAQDELASMVRQMKFEEVKEWVNQGGKKQPKKTFGQKLKEFWNTEIDMKKIKTWLNTPLEETSLGKSIKIGWNNFTALFVSEEQKVLNGLSVKEKEESEQRKLAKLEVSTLREMLDQEDRNSPSKQNMFDIRSKWASERKNPYFIFLKRVGLSNAYLG